MGKWSPVRTPQDTRFEDRQGSTHSVGVCQYRNEHDKRVAVYHLKRWRLWVDRVGDTSKRFARSQPNS